PARTYRPRPTIGNRRGHPNRRVLANPRPSLGRRTDSRPAPADRAVACCHRMARQQRGTARLRRHRYGGSIMTEYNRELLDKLSDEADHAEATRDAELPYQRRRSGAQAVYGLRLPTQRIEQLHSVAAARGVEPSVLARNWVIEQLDRAEHDDPSQQR